MIFKKTGFKDLWLCKPQVYQDGRGYFFEAFNKQEFKEGTGLDVDFVQHNQSRSSHGVLRGLHLQKGNYAQAKLIRVIRGRVLDAVTDLRRESETFGQSYTVELSAENNIQLFVPRGFAHGFLVLSPETLFVYSCDNYYDSAHELTLKHDDTRAAIPWPMSEGKYTLSEKDKQGLDFNTLIDILYE